MKSPLRQFNPRIFWENVLGNKERKLPSLFNYLQRSFFHCINALSVKGFFVPGPAEGLNRLKWILEHNRDGHSQPGLDLKNNIFEARSVLSRYSKINYSAKSENRYLSDSDLESADLTYGIYYKTLKQVSEFLAWAYNLQIPEAIQQMYSSVVEESVTIPEEELALLNLSDLADNPTARFPVIFILDNNIRMGEDDSLIRIEQGMNDLFEEIRQSRKLCWSVELCIFTCGGGPTQIVNFSSIDRQESNLNNMEIKPFGACKMGETIIRVLELLDDRLIQLGDRDVAVDWYRPWLIILSNGNFYDDISESLSSIDQMKNNRGLQVYVRASSPKANMENLSRIDPNVKLITSFSGFFADVFKSMQTSSYSAPGGERIHLINEKGFSVNSKP